MPKAKTSDEIAKAVEKTVASTAASRHVRTVNKLPVDPLISLSAGSSRQNPSLPLQDTVDFSAVRIHCSEITCRMTFLTQAEMEQHASVAHDIDCLLLSSDEEDVVPPPPKKVAVDMSVRRELLPSFAEHVPQEPRQQLLPPAPQPGPQQQRELLPPASGTAAQQRPALEWYQKKCTLCSYVTFGSTNPLTIKGQVAIMFLHYDLDHKEDPREEEKESNDEYRKI